MKTTISSLLAASVFCFSAAGQAQELELGDLMIRDGADTIRYIDVVKTPAPKWWMKGLPLPLFESSFSFLPPQAAWMKAYDFNGNGWLNTDEMTQAWAVRIAQWQSGKEYGPESLLRSDGKPLRGVMLSIPAERALRAAVDEMTGSKLKGRSASEQTVFETLESMLAAYWPSYDGGDGGRGTESDQGDNSARELAPEIE